MPGHVIVSTCGTSLLTNDLHGDVQAALRTLLQLHANHAEADIPPEALAPLRLHIERRRTQLRDASIDQSCRLSAELNGILHFFSRQSPLPSRDVHILVHTDTWLGERVAELLAEKLRQLGAVPQTHLAASLNTADFDRFREGLGGLVQWAAQTLPAYRERQYRVVFNLVGGFKSFQGFMQTLGMFHADETLYIFETGGQLLRIPRLPIDLDAGAKKVIADHLELFRRLEILTTIPSNDPALDAIPDSFFYRLGDETELSPFGKIVWAQARRAAYREKLHQPPTDRITYAEKFRNDAAGLPAERIEILNTRIDDLARHLLRSTSGPGLKRLDLKALRANPMPPATHECDAWADADCRRIFLSFDANRRAVLHRLTAPLH